MADENETGTQNGATPPAVKMQALAQYVRDLSFENVVAQKGISGAEVQPDIQVGVSLDARQRPQPNTYDVIAKFKVTSTNKANNETLFLLELEYGGVFLVEGVPAEQLHPFLLIECPRLSTTSIFWRCTAVKWPAVPNWPQRRRQHRLKSVSTTPQSRPFWPKTPDGRPALPR